MPDSKGSIHKELERRSKDRIRVYNPTSEDYPCIVGGYAHIVYAQQEKVLERSIAMKYLTEMTDRLITEIGDKAVDKENADRKKKGLKPLDPQERELFDVRGKHKTDNENLRKKYLKVLWKGIEEEYGLDKAPSSEAMKKGAKRDEDLIREMEVQPVEEKKEELAERITDVKKKSK